MELKRMYLNLGSWGKEGGGIEEAPVNFNKSYALDPRVLLVPFKNDFLTT